MLTTEHCMTIDCERKAEVRGVCKACYRVLQTLVKRGEATWELLENEKMVLPPVYRVNLKTHMEKKIKEAAKRLGVQLPVPKRKAHGEDTAFKNEEHK